MKYISNEDSVLPILVIILVVALVAVAGLAVYNVTKPAHTKTASTSTSTPSPSKSVTVSASPSISATPAPTDQQLILSVLLAQCVAGQGDHLGSGIVPDIQGDLAKASVTCIGA